jgi:protein TonB
MHPLVLVALAMLPSAAVHVLGMRMAAAVRDPQPRRVPSPPAVRIAVVERAPPIAVAAPQAPIVSHPRRRAAATPAPPMPAPLPPPPAEVAATEAPPMVAGLSLSATTTAGTAAVPLGNSSAGKPGTSAPAAGGGAPAEGVDVTPAYALTEQPVFLDNVSPAQLRRFYPEQARQTRLEGAVRVGLTIDENGTVVGVKVLADPGHGFGAAALRVARLYRFKPAQVQGRPVATAIEFTIHFELD